MPVQVESTLKRGATEDAYKERSVPPVSELRLPATLGFKTPESIVYDAASDLYFVANINGSPTAMDNNGFISQVNPDGSVRNLMFIAGGQNDVTLSAPKGLAIDDSVLYVTDVNAVRRFDTRTGKPLGHVALPRATFANDIAVGVAGTTYVSDSGLDFRNGKPEPTGTDAIYRLDGERVSIVAQGKHLEQPNGLLYIDGFLLCASFASNKLQKLSLEGEVIATSTVPGGALDGLVALPDGQIVVSSWETQSLYVGDMTRGFKVLAQNLTAPADIGVDVSRNRLLIPMFLDDELRFVDNSYSSATSALSSMALAPQL
jgi:sugar lactone lactonase YvrE